MLSILPVTAFAVFLSNGNAQPACFPLAARLFWVTAAMTQTQLTGIPQRYCRLAVKRSHKQVQTIPHATGLIE
jgi:hypothetical protein